MWNAERKLLCLYRSSEQGSDKPSKSLTGPGAGSSSLDDRAAGSGSGTQENIDDSDIDDSDIDDSVIDDVFNYERITEETDRQVILEIDKPTIIIWNIESYSVYGLLFKNDVEGKLQKHVNDIYLQEPKRYRKIEIRKEELGKIVLDVRRLVIEKIIREMASGVQFKLIHTEDRVFNHRKSNTIEMLISRPDNRPDNKHFIDVAVLLFTDDLGKY